LIAGQQHHVALPVCRPKGNNLLLDMACIHRWNWTLTLHPDGTTTAISPDGKRTLHSHAPPDQTDLTPIRPAPLDRQPSSTLT
jgi:hypothetical protein